MKLKVRSTVLVGLFVVFIVSVFIVFAILRNNSAPFMALIFLLFILVLGALLFTISLQLLNEAKKQTADTELSQTSTENVEEKNTENISEKKPERVLNIKNIIPKEKLSLEVFSEELLRNLAGELPIVQALLYTKKTGDELFSCTGKFAFYSESNPADFKIGETLPGQAVKNKSIVTISNVPENYMIIASGLGKVTPGFLTYIPIIFHDEAIGLIEFATFTPIAESIITSLNQFSEKVADSISKLIKK
jgi:hypothetical protein